MGRIRLQVVIAFVAIVLLGVAMAYLAFNISTVTVPDYGGIYREGLVGNPNAINPILSQSNPVDQDLVELIFTGLTRNDEKGEIVPDLAERWEISPDGTVYTFHLRRDVVWHDGAPLTASDVVYTISVIQNPNFQGSPFLMDLWRNVVVEQVDAYTVSFTLREAFAPFLDHTTLGLLPAHILGTVPVETLANHNFNAEPVGTGPFKVEESSARHLSLVANPDYYRSRPYIEGLDFIFYPSDAAVFQAHQRREIMGIGRVYPEYLKAVRDNKSLSLYSAPLAGYNLIYLNLDRGIFQDRAVRQAMMWALDRQKLVDEALGGQGIVIDSPILPNSWAYEPNVQHYKPDPRKAKAMLDEAGWSDRDGDGIREKGSLKLEFTLATNEDDPTRVRMIQAVADQLQAVGIRAVPQTVGWEELVGQMLRLRRFDAILSGWQNLPPDPDPYPYWHSSQASEDGLNFANYINQEVDLLLQDARSTNDRERRIELYRRFQEIFSQEVPSLLLYQPVYNYAVDESVHNVQIGPLYNAGQRLDTVARWYIATQRMLYSEAREKGLETRPR